VLAPKSQKLALAILTNVALLALLEGLVAFFLSPPEVGASAPIVLVPASRDEIVLGRRDAHLGWCFPASEFITSFGERSNSLGFRGPEPRATIVGPPRRIVCLGSGTTFGLGVHANETFASDLDRWLRRAGPGAWEVVNAGIPGYTPVQALGLLRRRARELRPSIVVVCAGVWDSYTPATDDDDDESLGILTERSQGRVARWLGRLRVFTWLSHWIHPAEPPPVQRPNDELAQLWRTLQQRPNGPRVPGTKFRRALLAIAAEAKRAGAKVVFVGPPLPKNTIQAFPTSDSYARIVGDVATERGCPFADARTALLEAEENAAEPMFTDEIHPSRAGHALMARTIAREIQTLGLPNIPAELPSWTPTIAIPLLASPWDRWDRVAAPASPGRARRSAKVTIPKGALLSVAPRYSTPADLGTGPAQAPEPGRVVEFEIAIVGDSNPRRVILHETRIVGDGDSWCRNAPRLVDLAEHAGESVAFEFTVRGPVALAAWGPVALVSFE
jgi:lysophospholipase L1-like esterase